MKWNNKFCILFYNFLPKNLIHSMFLVFLLFFFNILLLNAQDFSIVETTFKNSELLYDNDQKSYSVSEDLKIGEQFIVLNLKNREYIKDIEIYWDANTYSDSYKILGSIDYLNWYLIKGDINAGRFPRQDKNYINRISGDNKVAQFIKILIPQEKNKQKSVRISEIKLLFSNNILPKVLQYKINQITEEGAEIYWQTDYETLGQIRFGLNVNQIDKVYTEFFYTKEHVLILKELLKGKKYYFQIINQTPDNRYFTSKLDSFTTKGIPLPEIEEVKVNKNSYNFSELYIRSNIDTKLTLFYGKEKEKLNKKIDDAKFSKIHIIKINDLKPLNKYYTKIMLTDKGNNPFESFFEFETEEYNVALNKKVEGTFQNTYIADIFELKGDILKRVNDGSFDYQGGMAVSFNPMKEDQYVIIDLGKSIEIEKAITYWRALAYPYFYYLYFSNDKINWTKYNSNIVLKNKPITFIQGSGIPLIIGDTDLNKIKTRYVKLLVPKGTPFYKKYALYDFLQLMEFKIYGKYIGGY